MWNWESKGLVSARPNGTHCAKLPHQRMGRHGSMLMPNVLRDTRVQQPPPTHSLFGGTARSAGTAEPRDCWTPGRDLNPRWPYSYQWSPEGIWRRSKGQWSAAIQLAFISRLLRPPSLQRANRASRWGLLVKHKRENYILNRGFKP